MKIPIFPNGTVFTHKGVELIVHEYDIDKVEVCLECWAYGPNQGPKELHKCMEMPSACTLKDRKSAFAQFIELKRYTVLRLKGQLP